MTILKKETIESYPMGDLVHKWALDAQKRLTKRIPPNALSGFLEMLLERLSYDAAPALILEMHILKLQGKLQGASSSERYQFFVDTIDLDAFFSEYKVLKRYITQTSTLWIEMVEEFASHLSKDKDELEALFGSLGALTKIQGSLSDPHCGGRSVLKVCFEKQTLYYKPKPMKIAKCFHDFIDELNSLGHELDLKTYQVLDKGTYGWVEEIEFLPCSNKQEVIDHYTRAGSLLCIMYVLRGNDFHFENVICSGPYPMLVDLETFFLPLVRGTNIDELHESIRFSVLSTSYLPSFRSFGIQEKYHNSGGLMSEEEEISTSKGLTYENKGSDEMRTCYKHVKIPKSSCAVYLNGALQPVHDYIDEVVSGFKATYTFFLKNKERLSSLEAFANAPVRYVAKDTRLYAKLLQRLSDPTTLREERVVTEEIAVLEEVLLREGNEHLKPLFTAEVAALQNRDIPYFESRPNSCALYIGEHIILEDAFHTSAMELVQERIESMGDDDLALQLIFIKKSIYATKPTGQSAKRITANEAPYDPKLLMDHALSIGEKILDDSFIAPNGSLSWLSLDLNPIIDQMAFDDVGADMYNGASGIALFFAALFKSTKDPKWKKAAHQAMHMHRKVLHEKRAKRLPGALGIGGYSGVGSIIYALTTIGQLLEEPKWIDDAYLLATHIKQTHIDADTIYDVIGGSAGLILALLALNAQRPDAHLINLAKQCGNHLEKTARDTGEKSIGWSSNGNRPLLGFSHGVAGIGYALLKLSKALCEEKFASLAHKAFAYERNCFSPSKMNWPDYRDETDSDQVSWCNGAAGIGLARMNCSFLHQDAQYEEEIKTAQCTMKNRINHASHHLCCGTIGLLDVLSSIAKKQGDTKSLDRLKRQYTSSAIEAGGVDGYRFMSIVSGKIQPPGLMQGLAGIGYSYLRLLDETHQLPDLLSLE